METGGALVVPQWSLKLSVESRSFPMESGATLVDKGFRDSEAPEPVLQVSP